MQTLLHLFQWQQPHTQSELFCRWENERLSVSNIIRPTIKRFTNKINLKVSSSHKYLWFSSRWTEKRWRLHCEQIVVINSQWCQRTKNLGMFCGRFSIFHSVIAVGRKCNSRIAFWFERLHSLKISSKFPILEYFLWKFGINQTQSDFDENNTNI